MVLGIHPLEQVVVELVVEVAEVVVVVQEQLVELQTLLLHIVPVEQMVIIQPLEELLVVQEQQIQEEGMEGVLMEEMVVLVDLV